MTVIAGTTEGIFLVSDATSTSVADQHVNVLRRVNGSLLAGTPSGIVRSDDGGITWQSVGLDGCEVLDIAAAPADDRLLYAGTRPAALYRSRDGGATWNQIESFAGAFDPDSWGLPVPSWPPGARAHSIVVDARNPRRCLVGIEVGGVVVTDDDGETWSTVMPGGDPDIHVIVADPSRPQTLFASTGFGRIGRLAEQPEAERIAGMFVSDDGGREWRWLWESMNRQYTRPLCIDSRPPHAVTVGTAHSARPYITYRLPESADGRLYQSTDQGATWQSLGDADHSPSAAALLCIAPAADAAGNVLVGTDRGEVWHVAAEQSRWTLLASGLPPVQAVLEGNTR
jgi:photosystem II stability/assembly factor-like uncharacterized protein